MIEIVKETEKIFLKYIPEVNSGWIEKAIKDNEQIKIKRMFKFSRTEYIRAEYEKEYPSDEYTFLLGKRVGEYYVIKGENLYTSFDVYIHKDYSINYKMFNVGLRENTFEIMNKVYQGENLFIGGSKADFSEEEFREMLSLFPTYYERDLYVKSRIENIVKSYLPLNNDYTKKLNNYISKKKIDIESSLNCIDEYEIKKYELILNHLKDMIKKQSNYIEKHWQNEILKVITLIMPQYIYSLKSVNIRMEGKQKKQIDIILVNANGNVDIIEVKRYDTASLIGKNADSRGNYKPSANLSTAIMQAEKYAYLCNVYKKEVIEDIKKKIKNKYKTDFKVNIINPKTIIIMGNSKDMNERQKNDFELIRRMYINVIDIITYEDLIKRLEDVIDALKANLNV